PPALNHRRAGSRSHRRTPEAPQQAGKRASTTAWKGLLVHDHAGNGAAVALLPTAATGGLRPPRLYLVPSPPGPQLSSDDEQSGAAPRWERAGVLASRLRAVMASPHGIHPPHWTTPTPNPASYPDPATTRWLQAIIGTPLHTPAFEHHLSRQLG